MYSRQLVAVIVVVASGSARAMLAQAPAQDAARTVVDMVYTEAQAARGGAAYEAACAGCHRADLGGGTGPALKQQRFARQFADIAALKATILSSVDQLSAFAGKTTTGGRLNVDRAVLSAAPALPPVGDFSYVEVVGCLTPGPQNTWLLTRASAPAAATPSGSPDTAKPLGTETFHLVDALAYAPDSDKGHKIYVRGLVIKLPDEQRLTISVFESVSPTCGE